jgi:hypothetical protein
VTDVWLVQYLLAASLEKDCCFWMVTSSGCGVIDFGSY